MMDIEHPTIPFLPTLTITRSGLVVHTGALENPFTQVLLGRKQYAQLQTPNFLKVALPGNNTISKKHALISIKEISQNVTSSIISKMFGSFDLPVQICHMIAQFVFADFHATIEDLKSATGTYALSPFIPLNNNNNNRLNSVTCRQKEPVYLRFQDQLVPILPAHLSLPENFPVFHSQKQRIGYWCEKGSALLNLIKDCTQLNCNNIALKTEIDSWKQGNDLLMVNLNEYLRTRCAVVVLVFKNRAYGFIETVNNRSDQPVFKFSGIINFRVLVNKTLQMQSNKCQFYKGINEPQNLRIGECQYFVIGGQLVTVCIEPGKLNKFISQSSRFSINKRVRQQCLNKEIDKYQRSTSL